MPVIFLGDFPGDMPHVSRVAWDSGEAVRVAVEHLLATGRRRIGLRLGNDYPLTMHLCALRRLRTGAGARGWRVRGQWVVKFRPEETLEEILRLPSAGCLSKAGGERPDALFMMNDGLALPALEVLGKLGIRAPADVAVVGMGNLPLTGHAGISLSTVAEPVREMGEHAARVAVELIKDLLRAGRAYRQGVGTSGASGAVHRRTRKHIWLR